MTGNGIDDSVLYHMKHGIKGAGKRQFDGLICNALSLALIGFVLAIAAYRYSPTRRQRFRRKLESTSIQQTQMISIYAFIFSIIANPLSSGLYQLHKQSNLAADQVSKEEERIFQQLYHDPKHILTPLHDASFAPNKNFIYIYMESLERTYFDQQLFPHVVPRLRKWEEKAVSFTNLISPVGTTWTVAGLVASLCGIPLVTAGGSGNSMQGVNEFLPGVTCLPDLLHGVGYHQTYIGGADLDFAGKRNFLATHGFDTMLGRDEILGNTTDTMLISDWGIHDDTLLDIVFDKYIELASNKQPFGLYTLTLDTHDVHPSRRCFDDGILVGDRSFVDSIRCTDYLVDKFINRVLDTDYGNDTLIIVGSDHLAMEFARDAIPTLKRGKRRNTFFVLGSNSSETYDISGTIMDVGATILSFLGYSGEALGLGRDLRSGETLTSQDPNFATAVLQKMTSSIRQFWNLPNIRDYLIEIDVMAQQLRIGTRVYPIPVILNVNAHGDIDSITLDNIEEKTGAYHPLLYKYTESTGNTIALERCKYFESMLVLGDSEEDFCFFIKDRASATGQICQLPPLKSGFVAVDFDVIRWKATSDCFIDAIVKERIGLWT